MKERTALMLAAVLGAALLFLLAGRWPAYGWLIVLVSLFVADAASYIFHYIVDFYGDPSRPGIVRDFQLHHHEPEGIATAPLPGVLYPAVRYIVPGLAVLVIGVVAGAVSEPLALAVSVVLGAWAVAQLFHRWAHIQRPHVIVRALQASGLILRPWAHDAHHVPPYERSFAVVTGWSNPVLDALGATHLIDAVMEAFSFNKRGLLVREVRR